MKKFNEWLSFKSNVHEEVTPNDVVDSDKFGFTKIPGAQNSGSIKHASERLSKIVDLYGVRNNKLLLADLIKDIYDFSAPEEMDKLKRDLRYLLTHLEKNNNLDNIESNQAEQE